MVHVKYAHVYKGSCKLEVIPLPHEQTHTWIHTDYIFTSIYVYDLDFHTHIHYFHIYISLNINQRSACSQHSFLKNIAYDALLFLKLEHDIRIHLDQTFAWGPHSSNQPLNNTTPRKLQSSQRGHLVINIPLQTNSTHTYCLYDSEQSEATVAV